MVRCGPMCDLTTGWLALYRYGQLTKDNGRSACTL